jgi:DNA processing protein
VDKGLRDWLALGAVKGLERSAIIGLLKRLGSPGAIFEGCRSGLIGRESGLSERALSAIKGFKDWARLDDELGLAEVHGARVITFNDDEYPELLREINDPPYLLYAKGGSLKGKAMPVVAVVGTRQPTNYGRLMAEAISRDLAYMGVIVASGMARGCDSSAHRGALKAGGFTVAVLGTGIDVVYPRENRELYEEIAASGLLLSEYPISTRPQPYNFPRRNRIISGIALGVLVVEAPLRSGALMTANLALDYNREVFGVPGPVNSPKSRGSNRLIKDGAVLVECAEDVTSALGLEMGAVEAGDQAVAVGPDEKAVLEVLGAETLQIDMIIEKTGFSISKAATLLLDMEIKGLVVQRPGKCFIRRI